MVLVCAGGAKTVVSSRACSILPSFPIQISIYVSYGVYITHMYMIIILYRLVGTHWRIIY